MILYKPWTKVLLEIPKFDWLYLNVPWTQKRDVIDVWLASEMYADIGKKKCGNVIAKVDFCINATSYDINMGDYDNTQIKYIIFQSTLYYLSIQYILK